MKNIKREDLPTNRDGHFFKCDLYYDLGGWNYFSGGVSPRGYYVSVCPVERRTSASGITSECYTAFSGIRQCVLPCDRQGKKREQEAAQLYEAARDQLIALPRFDAYRIRKNEHVIKEVEKIA